MLEKHDIKTIERNEENSFIGPPIMESLVKLRNVDETVAGKITMEYRKRYIEKYLSKSNEYSGCREILTALIKDGQYYFAIATMKTEQQAKKLLSVNDMTGFFDTVKSASETKKTTKLEMLKEIKNEINAEKYYMVGDTSGDMHAAEAAGFIFIAADYGYGAIDLSYRPRISSLSDLCNIL